MAEALSRDEEVSLAQRIAAGDKGAEAELVTRNLPLVGKLARQFIDQGLDLCDLNQEGAIALIRAARSFDPGKATRFSTWAGLLVHQHLTKAVERVRKRPAQLTARQAMAIPARVEPVDVDDGRAQRVKLAVETVLDADERRVFDLKFGDVALGDAKIAAATGRSRASVGRSKRKALAKLKRSLNLEPAGGLARTG